MSLKISGYPLGMTMTNAYIVVEEESGTTVVIDPGFEGARLARIITENGWRCQAVWLTHAHFDHIGGVGALVAGLPGEPPVALHAADLPLWELQGGAPLFGIEGVDTGPRPSIDLTDGQLLILGQTKFEVRHAPGHTPGHVMFYCDTADVLFCGDVIFQGSIGRTDLPGGSYGTLMDSIRHQVLSLPDDTRLLNGHGPETTVGRERAYNPFLNM
jgi:glyoxylase-like metal-dependent hydrolase (beta-lactamase superfamily II)